MRWASVRSAEERDTNSTTKKTSSFRSKAGAYSSFSWVELLLKALDSLANARYVLLENFPVSSSFIFEDNPKMVNYLFFSFLVSLSLVVFFEWIIQKRLWGEKRLKKALF